MVQRSTVHGTAPCRNEQSAGIRAAEAPLELAEGEKERKESDLTPY